MTEAYVVQLHAVPCGECGAAKGECCRDRDCWACECGTVETP